MNEKLQELTQKIYNEGLEKGKKDAKEIVDEAKKEADKILKDAKKEAEDIKNNARKEADELKNNVHSELTISARQAVSAIKQQITGLVSKKAVDDALSGAFNDKNFIKSLIEKIADNWAEMDKSEQGVMLYLSESDREKLEKDLMGKVAKNIKAGMEINFEEGVKSGFKIGPEDGSYKISFTEKDFHRFFSQYLRPRTKELFAKDKEDEK